MNEPALDLEAASVRGMLEARRGEVDRALAEAIGGRAAVCGELDAAMRHAVFPGGKRWRPLLTLAAAELAGAGWRTAVPAAAAVELLHCSSLVFDDLPCMDDAVLRRGRAAVHVEFGEGVAVLTGIGLLTAAFGLLSGRGECVALAARYLGPCEMLGGQALDLRRGARPAAEQEGPLAAEARQLLNRKTTALVELALGVGALHGSATAAQLGALAEYGREVGLAYQELDDLDDGEGYPARGDSERLAAREGILARRARAVRALEQAFAPGRARSFLVGFAGTMVRREPAAAVHLETAAAD